MPIKKVALSFLSACILCGASTVLASELSLVTGLYQYKKYDPVKESRFNLGGRYGEFFSDSKNLLWYVDGALGTVSYSGRGAPDDGLEVKIGGGVRLFFEPLGDRFRPFAGVGGDFRTTKQFDDDALVPADVETSGIYYFADAGIRLLMGNLAEFEASDVSVFLDFQANLFTSALFATEKRTVTDPTTGAKTENKRTNFDLYVDGQNNGLDMTVALGLIF